MPATNIPVRVGVVGTPLLVQRERVLTKGLRARQWRTSLEFGQVPTGVQLQKTFYVFNTGSLGVFSGFVELATMASSHVH
jgi:hypothetical protein